VRRHSGHRVPNWLIGLLAIVIIVVGSLLAFTKQLPWRDAYEVQAIFTTAQNVRIEAPVRIAGVEVGKVTQVEHLTPEDQEILAASGEEASQSIGGGDSQAAAIVTMEISDEGRPLKEDATFQLRPRLFLEGNLFVDTRPGSPSAPEAKDGFVFGPDQTSSSVQLDQILTTLQSDVREQLQIALEEFGSALVDHGGAEGFQEAYRTSPGAFKYTSLVNEAFLGTEPHDLSNLIKNLDRVIEGLGRNEQQLQSLVTNFRIVSGSFAAQDVALEQAIAELPNVLDASRPAFANLNAAFPPLRAFAREALPGVRSTPRTLTRSLPLLRQLRLLMSKRELRGLVAELRPAIPKLAKLARRTPAFLAQARAVSSCFNEVVIPWGNDSVDPPPGYPFGAFGKVFQETGYGLTGIAGESRSGDANGQYIRVQAGGGTNTVLLPPGQGRPEQSFGITPFPLTGAVPSFSPQEDSAKTKFRPNRPCERQEPPDLGATLGTPPAQSGGPGGLPLPPLPPLPLPGFETAYESAISLASDFGGAEQLREDGEGAQARRLEASTEAEYGKLMDAYREFVDAVAAGDSDAELDYTPPGSTGGVSPDGSTSPDGGTSSDTEAGG
jgi:phospholipid/cholesterol/gamma-HCH transport system substrate-binding protein